MPRENLFLPIPGCWGFQVSPGGQEEVPLCICSNPMANPSVCGEKPAHQLSDVFLESFFDSSAAGEEWGSTGCCLQLP